MANNSDRALWAKSACEIFATKTGQMMQDESEYVIQDLITNLLHLNAELHPDTDASELIRRAKANFDEEVAEEEDDDV